MRAWVLCGRGRKMNMVLITAFLFYFFFDVALLSYSLGIHQRIGESVIFGHDYLCDVTFFPQIRLGLLQGFAFAELRVCFFSLIFSVITHKPGISICSVYREVTSTSIRMIIDGN
ncbi:hypothetical protein BJ138DRAFT_1158786 [Hygrophoropsis aurantiaca]|uniref:Uncharacterized protein n=1 Tax=Hygrophoropsis aurantiaca TaxID=72124 RepID=A0ACB8A3H1_9AGAM|nr:hypothetical protein BJ138DRAFT_1158786 [Hygrophoropsis aurantiaca]